MICHAVLMLWLGSFLLQDMSYSFWVLAFEGQSLKYSVNMFQNRVESSKPQAGSHVTGPCSHSFSRPNDVLLSLPTDILSCSLCAFFILHMLFFALQPQPTKCLEETTVFLQAQTPSNGELLKCTMHLSMTRYACIF